MHLKLLNLLTKKTRNYDNNDINNCKNLCIVPSLYYKLGVESTNLNTDKYILTKPDNNIINSDIYYSFIDNIKPNKKQTKRIKKKTRSTKKLKN
tara:strand:- start:107 stop:388 length:282 start_codon:yes stop_codon:yes gene_type:complete